MAPQGRDVIIDLDRSHTAYRHTKALAYKHPGFHDELSVHVVKLKMGKPAVLLGMFVFVLHVVLQEAAPQVNLANNGEHVRQSLCPYIVIT